MEKLHVFACVPQKKTLQQRLMGEFFIGVLPQGAGVRTEEQNKEGGTASTRMHY